MRAVDVTVWRRTVLASGLPLSAKVVALVLHEHMDWDGPEAGANCWPGLEAIGDEANMGRRSVTRALTTLDVEGFIERACRRGCDPCRGGNGHRMNYTATLPQPWHDVTPEQGHDVTPDDADGHHQQGRDDTANGVNGALSGVNGAPQRCHDDTGPSLDLPKEQSTTNQPETIWPDGWTDSHPKKSEYVSVLSELQYRVGNQWPVLKAEGVHVQKLRNAAARAAESDADPFELARVVTAKPLDGLTSYAAGLAKRMDDALPTVKKKATQVEPGAA